MINIVVKILGILLVLTGVILIYDARNITKKFLDLETKMRKFWTKNNRIYYCNSWRNNYIGCKNKFLHMKIAIL